MCRGSGRTKLRQRRHRFLGVWFALLLLPHVSMAEPVETPERAPVEVVTEDLSAEEMAKLLFPSQVSGLRTRGIHITDEAETPRILGLPIQFGLNSVEIAPASRPRLDEVGRMLGMEALRGQRLRIEGHTDASGSAAYNRQLSIRRAEAVARYLVDQHGVAAERLEAGGQGEDTPLPGRDPYDPVNRRVELSAAGPGSS